MFDDVIQIVFDAQIQDTFGDYKIMLNRPANNICFILYGNM